MSLNNYLGRKKIHIFLNSSSYSLIGMGLGPSKEFPTRRRSGVDDGQKNFGFGIRAMFRNYELLPIGFIIVGWSFMASYVIYRSFRKRDIVLCNKNRRFPYEKMDTENPELDKMLIVNQRFRPNPKFEKLKKIILGCYSQVEDVPYVWVKPPPTDECGRPIPPPEPAPAEATGEPGAEEPGAEEPGAEEPGAEEPSAEEPGAEEPGAKEPAAGEAGEGTLPEENEMVVPENGDVALEMNEEQGQGDVPAVEKINNNDNGETASLAAKSKNNSQTPQDSKLIANSNQNSAIPKKRTNFTPVPPKSAMMSSSSVRSRSTGTATPLPGKIAGSSKGIALPVTNRAYTSMSLTSKSQKTVTPSTKASSRPTTPKPETSKPSSTQISKTSSLTQKPESTSISVSRIASTAADENVTSIVPFMQKPSDMHDTGVIKDTSETSMHSHIGHSHSSHLHDEHEHVHDHDYAHEHRHDHLTLPEYTHSDSDQSHIEHSHSDHSHIEHQHPENLFSGYSDIGHHHHSETENEPTIIPRTVRSDE